MLGQEATGATGVKARAGQDVAAREEKEVTEEEVDLELQCTRNQTSFIMIIQDACIVRHDPTGLEG
jgi:hypothetical protein